MLVADNVEGFGAVQPGRKTPRFQLAASRVCVRAESRRRMSSGLPTIGSEEQRAGDGTRVVEDGETTSRSEAGGRRAVGLWMSTEG